MKSVVDDMQSELPASEDDPSVVVARLIEDFLAGLAAVGMERANAAKLMVIQGCVRLELPDLEEMQRYVNREVADWQEVEDEDDGDEAADAGDALH